MSARLADIPDDWQHGDLAQAIRYCRGFGLALDCGAHRGVTVRFLAQHFARVVAIEPSELADHIIGAEVIRACVGEAEGRTGMAHGEHNTGQRHCVAGDDYPVITIDSLNLLPDFIKLDVEGWELPALKGATATILRSRPVIMLEENGLNRRYGIADGEPGRFLESLGMKRVAVLHAGQRDQDWVYAFA